MPIDIENGYFPPRMPSQHFIKDEENINDILISEEEYINKYKRGEISERCISPFIYDKLKEKEKENKEEEKKISEENKSKKSEVINKKLKITKINLLKKAKTQIENNFNKQNEENEKMKSLLLKKKAKQRELMNFLYHGWQYDNESFVNNNYYSSHLNNIKILDDISRFGRKKQKFFSNLLLIKGKK